MKYSLVLDPGKTMSVSELRRHLAQVLSKLKGESKVTKLRFEIAIPLPSQRPDFPKGD